MTGAEHYKAAEELLKGRPVSQYDRAAGIGPKSGRWEPSRDEIAQAQAHATLAQAAATALCNVSPEAPMDEYRAWRAVAGPKSGDAS